MRIQPNSGTAEAAKTANHPQTDGAAPQSRLGADSLAMDASQTINQTLQAVPDVRADMVAKAKALLSDDSYPSSAQIGEVAALLAKSLSKQVKT